MMAPRRSLAPSSRSARRNRSSLARGHRRSKGLAHGADLTLSGTTHRLRQDGFTLVETLVALAILVLSLGPVYVILSGGALNLHTAEREAAAVQHARSLLASASVPASLAAGQRDGRTADGFTWHIDVAPHARYLGPAGDAPLGYWVSVRVEWPGRGIQRRSVAMMSFALASEP